MSAPHVTGVIAQMLEKNPILNQASVESKLKATALAIPANSMEIYDYDHFTTVTWGDDATGRGLIQADAAIAAIPAIP